MIQQFDCLEEPTRQEFSSVVVPGFTAAIETAYNERKGREVDVTLPEIAFATF